MTASVPVPPAEAFALFTRDIDLWWQRGPRFRASGARAPSRMSLEPGVGGRLVERVDSDTGAREIVFGEVTAWQPPDSFALRWRDQSFARHEHTTVTVEFRSVGTATHIRLVHAGWDAIRADHPARHGAAPRQFIDSLGRWWGDLLGELRERAR